MPDPEGKNPFKVIWNIISIPMGVLGLLSLSDSLITFHSNIQNIINSYHMLVYPVFNFIFAWLWFDVPTFIFDYLFFGMLFASSERKVWGFIKISENNWETIGLHVIYVFRSILFWPFIILSMAHKIYQTDASGLITSLTKEPKPVFIKYNYRDGDILVFRYLGAVLLLFILVLIINYTYFILA